MLECHYAKLEINISFANCNFRIVVLDELEIVNDIRNYGRCWSVST